MAQTVQERVRKYRAKKRSTEKGHKELLAINRQYKKRYYRKKEIANLIARRSAMAARLAKEEIGIIVAESRAMRARMLAEKFEGRDVKAMTVDERQELDLETLRCEIRMLQYKLVEKLRANSGSIDSGDAQKVDLAGGWPRSAAVSSHAKPFAVGAPKLSKSSAASAGPASKTVDSTGQPEPDVLGNNLTPTKTMNELYEAFDDGVLEFGREMKEDECARMRALVSASALLQTEP